MKLVKFACPKCGDVKPKETWNEESDDMLSLEEIQKYECSECGYISTLI